MSTAPRRMPARYIALLRDHLHAQGVDTAELFRMAGVDEALLDDAEGRLLPDELESIIATARRITGRTDLGFELGLRVKMNSHGLLGFGMMSCRTWDEAMRLVARHYHLMLETVTLRYQRRGALGEAVYTPLMAMPLETLRFYLEGLATSHYNQVKLLLGDQSYDFYLSMPEPPHARRYLALAPARFHFVEGMLPGVRVVMGPDVLDAPMPLADARVVRQVDERCEALSQRPPVGDNGWGDYVRMMLREAGGEPVTLEDLAQRVRVSARTIDRYLKRENLQFRDLSQQIRFERACELLRAPGATVAQVALSLGFSDAANFSRAFRRVVGATPSEFQQAARGIQAAPF